MIAAALLAAAVLGALAHRVFARAGARIDRQLCDELVAIEIERGEIR